VKKLLIVLVAVLLMGCGNQMSSENISKRLPTEATNIESVGDGWVEFDYNGQRLLMFTYAGLGYKGYSAMTVIGESNR
jgi:hypothetical protein